MTTRPAHSVTLRRLALLISAFAFDVALADDLPRSPREPTAADCEDLMRAYAALSRSAHEGIQQCMQGPAHIGPGQEIVLSTVFSTCAVLGTIRAWPQCFDIEQQSCQLGQTARREIDTCRDRVRARDASGEATLSRVNDMYDQSKSATSTFETAADFIRDPREAILSVLVEQSSEAADRLFDPDGYLRQEQFEEANQLYRFAVNPAADALLERNNGLIRGIQQSALDRITRSFARTFAEFDVAVGQMDELSRPSAQSSRPAPAPIAAPQATTDPYAQCKGRSDFMRCVDEAVRAQ